MPLNLHSRDFLKEVDFSTAELQYLLDLSHDLKRAKATGTEQQRMRGNNVALIFEKTSTRTRCAFEVAAYDQGGHVTYLDPNSSQIGHKESAADTAQVLARMFDAIEFRGKAQATVEELAASSAVPVYNGLTDEWHPTQMLADFLTMTEHSGKRPHELAYCFMGDGRFNMGRSLLVTGAIMGADKLRLGRIMQGEGLIVAMTGDAVNDAAALKQADVGLAMGSRSEVSKQAAHMVLTDDNFGTLVHAVELGRSIYGKVVSYIRYQVTQLLSLVLLFVTATVFDINSGVAMTPLMVLFLNFFVSIFPVVVIMLDPADLQLMRRPPRDPKVPITNGPAVTRWAGYGAVLFVVALVPLIAGPDTPSTDHPSASMTMCYVVIGLGTILSGVVMRRDPTAGLTPPILTAVKWSVLPTILLVLSTTLDFLEHGLMTQPLSGLQWPACIGLALVLPVVVELDKWIRRICSRPPVAVPVEAAVTPVRAIQGV